MDGTAPAEPEVACDQFVGNPEAKFDRILGILVPDGVAVVEQFLPEHGKVGAVRCRASRAEYWAVRRRLDDFPEHGGVMLQRFRQGSDQGRYPRSQVVIMLGRLINKNAEFREHPVAETLLQDLHEAVLVHEVAVDTTDGNAGLAAQVEQGEFDEFSPCQQPFSRAEYLFL